MLEPPSNSSPNSWIAAQNGWVQGEIIVNPEIPFETLVNVVTSFLGLPLIPTRAFDEFPAVLGHGAEHEVVIFGLPDQDAVDPDWVPKYRISIFPEYPEGHSLEKSPPRDVSAELQELLTPLLPGCQLTTE
jgi:hypothetical protein